MQRGRKAGPLSREKVAVGPSHTAKGSKESAGDKKADGAAETPKSRNRIVHPPAVKIGFGDILLRGDFFVSFSLAAASMLLSYLVETHRHRSHEDFPTVPILAVAIVASVMAPPLSHIVGYQLHASFRLWQPFQGGAVFIGLQVLGWTLYGHAFFAAIMLSTTQMDLWADNVALALGCLTVASHFLLSLSVRYFVPYVDSIVMMRGTRQLSFSFDLKQMRETLVGLVLAISSFVLFAVSDLFEAYIMTRHVPVVATVTLIVATPITHYLGGMKLYPNTFKVFMPFMGGRQFVLLQALGWTFYSVCVMMSILITMNRDEFSIYAGLFTSIGFFGFISQGLVFASLKFYKPNASTVGKKAEKEVQQYWLSSTEIILGVLISVSSFVWFMCAELYKHTPQSHWALFMYFGAAGNLLSTPLVYVIETTRKKLKLWKPFQGGFLFILLQMSGWFFYSTSVLFSIICCSYSLVPQTIDGLLVAVGFTGIFGHFLISTSMRQYDPQTRKPNRRNTLLRNLGIRVSSGLSSASDDDYDDVDIIWGWNGETLVSLVLSVASFSGFFFMDLLFQFIQDFVKYFRPGSVSLYPIIAACSVAFIFSAPIAHVFGAKKIHASYSIWQPFLGGAKFVFLQMIGWLLYGSVVVVHLHLLFSSTDLLHFGGVASAVGVLGLISNIFLMMSIRFYEEPDETVPAPISAGINYRNVGELFISIILSVGYLGFVSVADYIRLTSPSTATTLMTIGVVILFAAGPIIHCVLGRHWHKKYILFQPFIGGWKFIVLQSIGWAIYAVTLNLVCICLYFGLENVAQDGLISAIGIMGFGSLLALIASIPFFDPTESPKRSILVQNGAEFVSLLLALFSLLLFLVVDSQLNTHGATIPVFPAVLIGSVATCIAAPLSHFIGGRSKYSDRFSFFQPFVGGFKFVIIQAFAWIAYTFTMILCLVLIYYTAKNVNPGQGLMTLTGTGAVAAQVLVFWSLPYFESKIAEVKEIKGLQEKPTNVLEDLFGIVRTIGSLTFWMEIFYDFRSFVIVTTLYTWHLFVFAIFSFTLLFFQGYGLIFILILAVPYAFTYDGSHRTGARKWHALRNAIWIFDSFQRYFQFKIVGAEASDFQIAKDGDQTGKAYMFGMHPHGIYPYTCIWGLLTSAWRTRFPKFEVDSLGASVLMMIPGLRDLGMWLGGRDVSKDSILHCLNNNQSLILVPGGQAEMRLTSSNDDSVSLITRHKGFVRLALTQGAPLVPVFSFGEHKLFDNIHAPSFQRWSTSRLGFPYPHFPYGRLFLPIPRAARITLAIGKPIHLPLIADPTQEDVDHYHEIYFNNLKELFYRHRKEAGYESMELKLYTKHI